MKNNSRKSKSDVLKGKGFLFLCFLHDSLPFLYEKYGGLWENITFQGQDNTMIKFTSDSKLVLGRGLLLLL